MLVANSENRLRLVFDSDERLRSIIADLEESRAELAESGYPDAALILAMAILQLRMRLHGVADSELKGLCEVVLLHEAAKGKETDALTSKNGCFSGRGSRWPNSIK